MSGHRRRTAAEIINRSGQNGINPIRLSVAQAATRAGVHLNPADNNTENGSGDHATRAEETPLLFFLPVRQATLLSSRHPALQGVMVLASPNPHRSGSLPHDCRCGVRIRHFAQHPFTRVSTSHRRRWPVQHAVRLPLPE